MYFVEPVAEFMELKLPDSVGFRGYFIAIGVANFVVCMLIEKLVTGNETVRLKFEEKSKHCCSSFNSGEHNSTWGLLIYCHL